jgi:hypothetical protein
MRLDLQPGDDAAVAARAAGAESVVLVLAEPPAGFVESVLRPLALALAPRRVNAVLGSTGDVAAVVAFLEQARFTTGQAVVLDQPRVRPQAPTDSITNR